MVSVITTIFNREKYLAACIESVLNSSYTDFEYILVDDNSSDNSFEIAKSYAKTDLRIKVYRNTQNLGDYPNRNQAASYATRKYIKYLDADDLIYWYGLEVMIRSMEQFPGTAIGISHSKPQESFPYPFTLTSEIAYREHFLGRGVFNYGPTGLIINREIFVEEKGFKTERFLGDTEFLLRIAAKYPMVKMAPGLIWWRQHDGQEISKGNQTGYYQINTFLLNMSKLKSTNNPLSHSNSTLAIARQKQNHARRILAMAIKQKDPHLAWKVLKKSDLSLIELFKGLKPYQ